MCQVQYCLIFTKLYKVNLMNPILRLKNPERFRDVKSCSSSLCRWYNAPGIHLKVVGHQSKHVMILWVFATVAVGIWDMVALLWVTILSSYCLLVKFEVLYSSPSLCFLPLFHSLAFSRDRRLAVFPGFTEGSSFPLQSHQNRKQQQGPHETCSSIVPVLVECCCEKRQVSAMGQQLSLRHRLSWWKQPVGNMVLFWKGCRPESSTCILTLFGKPVMLLEGNGFIKVLTPMKAAVCGPMSVFTSCHVLKMPLFSMN